jgi:hypothetical protein
MRPLLSFVVFAAGAQAQTLTTLATFGSSDGNCQMNTSTTLITVQQ